MKNSILGFVWPILAIACPAFVGAQAYDLPDKFEKKVFIQHINFAEKAMLSNHIKEGDIIEENIKMDNVKVFDANKVELPVERLKVGMEILLEGNEFKVDKFSEAVRITILDDNFKDQPSTRTARIDLIVAKDSSAYVDGHRVKLKAGKKITGKNGTRKRGGYEGQIYDRIAQIKEGDFAKINGKYNLNSFYEADDFEIAPEDETKADKAAMTVDEQFHNKYYKIWTDKSKRAGLFNQDVPGKGKIYANEELQNYVQKVGLSLVPKYITDRDKIKFMFIVIDNPVFNADIRSNGLAFINTGLLVSLKNEAQLAAVLGHEISHALYEHVAKESRKRGKTEDNKSLVDKVGTGFKNTFKSKSKDPAKSAAEKQSIDETADNTITMSKLFFDVRLSDYSIDQESQADRVGLSLMAMANYDPKEAPAVWKNIYSRYNIYDDNREGADITKTITDEAINDLKKSKSEILSKENAKKWVNFYLITQSKGYKARRYKTHPDDLKRFRDLNHLVAMYWADPALSKNFKITPEEEYSKKMARLKSVPKK